MISHRRILVCGASGLLGHGLVPFLKSLDLLVTTQSFSGPGDIQADLTNPDEAKKLIENTTPDIVINLAALTNVDECEKFPEKAKLLNVNLVQNLVSAIGSKNILLIHISTDQLYDGEGLHLEENPNPKNVYAKTKLDGEKEALKIKSIILRTTFFGRSQHPTRPSFSDWLINCFKNRTPIKLFTDVYVSPLSIKTLCKEIARVIENPVPGIYNLGSLNGMSKRDFAYTLAKRFNHPIESHAEDISVSESTLLAFRPKNMLMDCTKYMQTYDCKLPTLVDEINNF